MIGSGGFAGLGKTVAYVRFISRSELVASTVNSTLSLWSWEPMERLRTLSGHVNVRNFVGMETSGDYVACGSETSQVPPLPIFLRCCVGAVPAPWLSMAAGKFDGIAVACQNTNALEIFSDGSRADLHSCTQHTTHNRRPYPFLQNLSAVGQRGVTVLRMRVLR